jgi:hypothetical protein
MSTPPPLDETYAQTVVGAWGCPDARRIQSDTVPGYGALNPDRNPGDPELIPTDTAEAVGLAKDGYLNSSYAIVQNMYKAILIPWLVEELNLATYDQELAAAGIPSLPRHSIFSRNAQQCTGVTLSYLYIRNIFYIERLTQEHINTFLDHAMDPDFVDNDNLRNIVMDTYPRVIRFLDSNTSGLVSYHTAPPFFPNDAVVVELGYPSSLWGGAQGRLVKEMAAKFEQDLQTHWPGNITVLTQWA